MDEVDLTKIGLVRIAFDARAVFDRGAAMSVALDAEAGDQGDAVLHWLGECVRAAAVDGENGGRCRRSDHASFNPQCLAKWRKSASRVMRATSLSMQAWAMRAPATLALQLRIFSMRRV